MDNLPAEILLEIILYLGVDATRSRLVNRTWNKYACEINRRVHSPVEFFTTREVKSFVSLMKTRISQPVLFLSKFIFDFRRIHISSVQVFSWEIGPHAREYTIHPRVTGGDLYMEMYPLTMTLLQGSPNIVSLKIDTGFSSSTESLLEYQLPLFRNLLEVDYGFHSSGTEFIIPILQMAPNLRTLTTPRIFLSSTSSLLSETFLDLCLLQTKAKLKSTFLIPEHGSADALNRLKALNQLQNRIQDLTLHLPTELDQGILNSELEKTVYKFLSKQSQSLKSLCIYSPTMFQLPEMTILNTLEFSTQWLASPNLSPSNFPQLSRLTLWTKAPISLLTSSVWENVKTLKIKTLEGIREGESVGNLPLTTCNAFPNLMSLNLETGRTLRMDLKYCLSSFVELRELCFSCIEAGVIQEDFWKELFSSTRGSENDALDDTNFRCRRKFESLKSVIEKNCDIGTVEAFIKVSEARDLKLDLIDLEVNARTMPSFVPLVVVKHQMKAYLKALSSYHKKVVIRRTPNYINPIIFTT